MQFDLVSDLHIDFWDDKTNREWITHKKSNTVIVAGDTSDDPDITFDFLHELQCNYDNVLYVDGNHEHQKRLHEADASDADFHLKASFSSGDFLGNKTIVLDDVAFIGCNGWWSFDFGEPTMPMGDCLAHYQSLTGFDDNSISKQKMLAERDADYLHDKVMSLSGDSNIRSIVVVTHTLPHKKCISWNEYPPDQHFTGLYGNTRHEEVLDCNHKGKLKYWLFGHNHDVKRLEHNGTQLISNPRGRPKDYNREVYRPLTLEV